MPTIAATAFPDEAYVRVDVSWLDIPAVLYARVIRINTVTGEETLLRPYVAYNAAGDLLLDCGLGVWWDTEPPIGVPLQYRTEAADILTNAAINSSFEAGTAPWVGAGGTLTQSAVFFHAGANSGLMTPTGSAFASTIAQTSIPVIPGLPMTASGWVLSPQGWNAVRLRLRFFNGVTQVGVTVDTPMEIVDDVEWRYLTVTATPPTDATTASLTFEASGTPPAATLFYVDQLEAAQYVPVPNIATTAALTVTATFPFYLKDPVNPCNDRALTKCMPGPLTAAACNTTPGMMVQSYGPQERYDPNSVLLQPVNRRRPIPVVRERRDVDSLLTIITRTFADRDLVKATLQPGTPLLFQSPPEYGIADAYIAVGVVSIDRGVPDHRIQPRFFSLPHSAVDRPDGPANGVCGARIDDLCDIYATWSAMFIAGLTYTDLLRGTASPSGPGQPPLAGLRTFDEVKAEFATFNAVNNGVRTFTGLRNGL